MNVLEKAEKSLEYLKNVDRSAKSHELQAAAGTLGRCLGALGTRQNCARHFANLLNSAIPVLLGLACNDNAEVRLLGDEALNRAVVGGFAFHSYKVNIILQNQIDSSRNARWNRAILSRICLGNCWLRPGVGKIRSQAQTLFPKLSEWIRTTSEVQIAVEALESNLQRLMDSLAEYTSDEEISELSKALLDRISTSETPVRRGVASCIACLISHRETLLTNVLERVYEKLWPTTTETSVVLGWFNIVKCIFQTNELSKFIESDLFTVYEYLELYHLCITYLNQTTDHNIHNCIMECLTTLLSHAKGAYIKALLDNHPKPMDLSDRKTKGHRRNISAVSTAIPRSLTDPQWESKEPEFQLSGALQLGSLLQLASASGSVDDLSIQTPGSPSSDSEIQLQDTEQLTRDLTEKLQEIEEPDAKDDQADTIAVTVQTGYKINIGSASDEDIPLKYCARLIASKFLLAGNKGDLICDRQVRVSVKASALTCLSEVLHLYPQAMTMYLDKDAEIKGHNVSGSSETTDSQDHTNDFILERNVCYQDSMTDSLGQELLNHSTDSHTSHALKKDNKSLEKSQDSVEQKSSSKDVQSTILDSKAKELFASAITDMTNSTNPNMTNSNVTTNSNMTASNTGYPMSSSGDLLSSSIDLEIKFDHFGESTTNLDNLKDLDRKKRLARTDEVTSKDAVDGADVKPDETCSKSDKTGSKQETKNEGQTEVKETIVEEKVFEHQHMSDIFVLLNTHNDPQIRGLVRVCIGSYLGAALDLSHGDYHRWKNFMILPIDVSGNLCTDVLVEIVLKGLSDQIHSTVNHTLSTLTNLSTSLINSAHWSLIINVLNSLLSVEGNKYWLCRVNLCKLYQQLPYKKLVILYPEYNIKSKVIMNSLFRLLGDQDQRVRDAAAQTITSIIPKIYPSKRHTPITMLAEITKEESAQLNCNLNSLSLELVRDIYFYQDLPDQLKSGEVMKSDNLRVIVGELMGKFMAAGCKFYSQGILETLQALCLKWSPWKHPESYVDQGILSFCLDHLIECNDSVAFRALLLDVCRLVYPVEIHNIMRHRTTNRDIFERDTNSKEKWQHLQSDKLSKLSDKFLLVTLKMLNVIVHLIEEVNPNVHLNKSSIALPGSPVRRKTQDSAQRKSSLTADSEEKGLLKKKPLHTFGLKGNLVGHFYNEPFYMKLYENLRAMYSNHKINLNPTSSIFHKYLTTILNCLAIQLELSTEKEFGPVTEEILFYLRVTMPLNSADTVYCITQLLKCLFGTNMINQYGDFMSIADKIQEEKGDYFDDIMLHNPLKQDKDSRRSSVTSNASQKLSIDTKNPRMLQEKQLLIAMENFSKNRSDRKWGTNKSELERYIRLFEPVVIQALKSYTMQNDIELQCQVLSLLNQLLALRVNYCMLDSGQVFIGYLLTQLELVEQHEIPNSCQLVNGILMFLVQLSSSKHHTKQIIEIPKLIQLCDGLMAAGAHSECIAGLEPVAVKVFSSMGGNSVLGRAQQQEAQATKEVLFYMLQKTMHTHKVLDLVSVVLSLSQEHPESYYRWSELASDTLINLLTQRSIELDSADCVKSLERLLDSVYRDVLLDQSRVEATLKILFKAPPESTASFKQKVRYLSIIMVLLRKVLILVPESEILLSINYLKASFISPQSIFFNVKTNVDPLNVQNVNENCANLSPDVILVRFLFKTLTFAILETNSCHDSGCSNLDLIGNSDEVENSKLMYSVCVNCIIHVKNMLHLTDGCLFPLTAKTGQNLLHNEQSGLNTGLYSPEENIPLDFLNLICLRSAHRMPLLTVHWSHLLIRMNFLSHKYWQKLLGFARNLPLSAGSGDSHLLRADVLQTACVIAYCEYFVENGLSEVVHLTWLLVNRVHTIVSEYREPCVRKLIDIVQNAASASGLLLQAVAARCQPCLQDEFALNTCKILSQCHDSQSGALVILICRIIEKLEPAIAVRFAKLAIDRCKLLQQMPVDQINVQMAKEDLQVALETLQKGKVKFSSLVNELNSLATMAFDLSPIEHTQDRKVCPNYIFTSVVDRPWLMNLAKVRCCEVDTSFPRVPKHNELGNIIYNIIKDDMKTILTCPDLDRKVLCASIRVSTEKYLKEFLNAIATHEMNETERDIFKEQKEKLDEMVTSIDSNKLNVANTLQVFKKSDNKQSKSQFFIPITEDNENSGNADIKVDDEISIPKFPRMYRVAIGTFDNSLSELLRMFPKYTKAINESDVLDLNNDNVDRYARRCHVVFEDRVFNQEFMSYQLVLTAFLESVEKLMIAFEEADCDLLEKHMETILPLNTAKNIATFSVYSLHYLSFLVKNKKMMEGLVDPNYALRAPVTVTRIVVDNVLKVTLRNIALAFSIEDIWRELNNDSNINKAQSSISGLYTVVKYLVKDTKPLVYQKYMQTNDKDPIPDIIRVGNKLITLVEYWEQNMYKKNDDVLPKCFRKPIESLISSLSRLNLVHNIALIPPIAWPAVDVAVKDDVLNKIDLPLQALQDPDVLEPFLFRVNLIGWSSKKQFEEIWVALIGALQGPGAHWSVLGATQLLINAMPKIRNQITHVPRSYCRVGSGMQLLQNILIGTKAYKIFEEVNLERIPLMDDDYDGFHWAQFSVDYLKYASDIVDNAPYKVRKEVKRMKKQKDLDINSCLQLLMDVTTQMLDPKCVETSSATTSALIKSIGYVEALFVLASAWCGAAHCLTLPRAACHSAKLLMALATTLSVLHGFEGLQQEITTVHQKLLKSLTSSYAPLRIAALHGCLLQLTGSAFKRGDQQCQELITELNSVVRIYLTGNNRMSLYEKSLYWTVLFTLIEIGHADLINIAADFVLANPNHYCTDMIVKGIITVLRQQVLPKELKNAVIEKFLDNMKDYKEDHAVQILLVHLFSADTKLLSPKLASDVSNMDPDILMNSMERITLLYRVLREVNSKENKDIITSILKYFLRETLPPAATLSRVVIEFLESCKEVEREKFGVLSAREKWIDVAVSYADIVFEVFEASVTQDQLPVLSGWTFEALRHLLQGKISSNLLPYCLYILLISASPNRFIRKLPPIALNVFKSGFYKYFDVDPNLGIFKEFLPDKSQMVFLDRRLLCMIVIHSGFAKPQLYKVKDLCENEISLNDLKECLVRWVPRRPHGQHRRERSRNPDSSSSE